MQTTEKVENLLKKVNYRLTVGLAAIIFGSCIIVFNVMMALFY